MKEVVDKDNQGIMLFDVVDPKDIKQGSLGVCYFLCSLSLLAEHKGMVRSCFNSEVVNEQGLYSLNFFIMGAR